MRIRIKPHKIYLSEPVGKQFKYWFLGGDKKYLYKRETKKSDGSSSFNDVSECMSMEIGKLLGIPIAQYYLCKVDNDNGIITPDFLDNDVSGIKKEEFMDGVYLIGQIDPNFKNKSLINPQTHQYYTVDLILQSLEKYDLIKPALEMIVYDALIGNRDRNPSNYGIIINHDDNTVRFSPLFDNCTSLGISMAEHRLNACYDSEGNVIDNKHLNVVIHKHILGKVTLDRSLQYKEKREWDVNQTKEILKMIEVKKRELYPLLESGKISIKQYHSELNIIGTSYKKYDVSTLLYQPLISYLTLFYPDEIGDIMKSIEDNITEKSINIAFDFYTNDLPAPRMAFAKKMVLDRAKWMINFYNKNKESSRGKIL